MIDGKCLLVWFPNQFLSLRQGQSVRLLAVDGEETVADLNGLNSESESDHVVAFFDQQNVFGARQDVPVTADARTCCITERKHSAGLGNDGEIPLVCHYPDSWHVDKSFRQQLERRDNLKSTNGNTGRPHRPIRRGWILISIFPSPCLVSQVLFPLLHVPHH